MIRVGEMLEGKDRTRPVARSTTQNNPPRTDSSLIQSSRTSQAAACWGEAAAAMRDAGDHEEAVRLEQLAANAQTGQHL
jgi:hypothetical protein